MKPSACETRAWRFVKTRLGAVRPARVMEAMRAVRAMRDLSFRDAIAFLARRERRRVREGGAQ